MQLIDGKKLSNDILQNVKTSVEGLLFTPVFCDVLVGDDFASKKYVEMKAGKAESVGMQFYRADFPESVTTDELVSAIYKLNRVPNMCGIIVQLPLPGHIDEQKVLDAISPALDVDALGSVTNDNFYNGMAGMGLPTAMAVMHILDSLDIDLSNKSIAVLGQGKLVGRPVMQLLESRGLSPTPVRSTTEDGEQILRGADVVITGIGRGHYVKGDMIKPGAIIIDAGTSESGAGLVGDVDPGSVDGVAGYLSPCPGGVGPVTVAMLFHNVLEVAKKINLTP